jgi:predicted short-subunit dehydrogenase-like oxidoreductase (DUF2520 family)
VNEIVFLAMQSTTSVSFVGAGNLAWHLAPALDNAGYTVLEVYSRSKKNALALVNKLYQAEVKEDLDFSDSKANIFVLSVTDDALPEVLHEIILPDNAILVHTSGSQPLLILSTAATLNTGVFYPLQTFTKQKKVDFSEIPLFVECMNPEVEKHLMKMGKAISKKVLAINASKRMALHVAAVFASNFTNHMLTISKSIMDVSDLPYDWVKPLISETINKSLAIGPEAAQTGPAVRGDLETLDRHMALLQEDGEIAELYQLISQHIINTHDQDE